jgi:hypothetical protein
LIKPESAVGAGGVAGLDGVGLIIGLGVNTGELLPVGGMITAGIAGVGANVAVEAGVGESALVDELVTDAVGLLDEGLPALTQPVTKPSDNRIIEARATWKILIVFDIENPSFKYFLKPKLIRLS